MFQIYGFQPLWGLAEFWTLNIFFHREYCSIFGLSKAFGAYFALFDHAFSYFFLGLSTLHL